MGNDLPSVDEMQAIVQRAQRKNATRKDLQALRELLDQVPALASGWVDLTQQTYSAVFESLAGNPATEMILAQSVNNLRAKLGYADAPLIEALLIDAVVLAWLRYTDVERRANSAWSGSHTLARGAYWDKRLSAAQRRYLRAIETLARIRKLGPKVLQVNIAAQQINQANA